MHTFPESRQNQRSVGVMHLCLPQCALLQPLTSVVAAYSVVKILHRAVVFVSGRNRSI